MYVVQTNFLSTDVPRSGRYTIEEFVNGTWKKRESVDVGSGEKSAKRKFLLEKNQRLVFEEISDEVAVWDNEQKATKMVSKAKMLQDAPEETEYSTEYEGEL